MSDKDRESLEGRLGDKARELPESIEPSRDLWPGIESQIRTEKRKVVRASFPWRPMLLAAAAVGAIVIVGTQTDLLQSGTTLRSPADILPGFAGLEQADADYAAAHTDVMQRLENRGDELDPETVEEIRRNLTVIDDAVENIQEALENDPANVQLNQMLQAGYQRRGAVLRRAAEIAESI